MTRLGVYHLVSSHNNGTEGRVGSHNNGTRKGPMSAHKCTTQYSTLFLSLVVKVFVFHDCGWVVVVH